MENWLSKLQVPEMPGTLRHAPITGGALEVPVIRAQAHVQEPASLGQVRRWIVRLRQLDLGDRACFL